MDTKFNRTQISRQLQAQLEPLEKTKQRIFSLRVWQLEGNPSFEELGRSLIPSVSGSRVQAILKGRRISFKRHAEFLALGVPEHLLPPPQVIPIGRPPQQVAESAAL